MPLWGMYNIYIYRYFSISASTVQTRAKHWFAYTREEDFTNLYLKYSVYLFSIWFNSLPKGQCSLNSKTDWIRKVRIFLSLIGIFKMFLYFFFSFISYKKNVVPLRTNFFVVYLKLTFLHIEHLKNGILRKIHYSKKFDLEIK